MNIKRFCKYGHDTLLLGRTEFGYCIQCRKDKYIPHPRKLVQFCPKGHDTFVVGRRISNRRCLECEKQSERKWNKLHKEEAMESSRRWKINNPQKVIEGVINWQKKNSNKVKCIRRNNEAKRRMRGKVDFGQEGILEFYLNCPEGMDVDHIIPLCGRKISGLHVKYNLQYMDGPSNTSKFNHCNLLEASEWYGKILEHAGLKEKN